MSASYMGQLRRWASEILLDPERDLTASATWNDVARAMTLRYSQIGALAFVAVNLLYLLVIDRMVYAPDDPQLQVTQINRTAVALGCSAYVFFARWLRTRLEWAYLGYGATAAVLMAIGTASTADMGSDGRGQVFGAVMVSMAALFVVAPLGVRLVLLAADSCAFIVAILAFGPDPIPAGELPLAGALALVAGGGVLWTGTRIEESLRKSHEHRKHLRSRVHQRTHAIRELARAREARREHERVRLARELHDDLGQLLTAARIELEVARLSDEAPPGSLERVRDILRNVGALQTRLSKELEPRALPSSFGPEDIRTMAARLGIEGLSLHWPAAALLDPSLPRDRTAYRVIQESLTNIARHAQAQTVHLQWDGRRLVVEDDGVGRRDQPEGHGLRGLRERALLAGATLSIGPAKHSGTRVELRFDTQLTKGSEAVNASSSHRPKPPPVHGLMHATASSPL